MIKKDKKCVKIVLLDIFAETERKKFVEKDLMLRLRESRNVKSVLRAFTKMRREKAPAWNVQVYKSDFYKII